MTNMSSPFLHRPLSILDLPWNDVLIIKVIPYLRPSEWLSLRAVSRNFCILVTSFFQHTQCLDLSLAESFPKAVWELIVQECCQLRTLILPNFKLCDEGSLRVLFQNNPNLKNLDLTGCVSLKNGSLQPLVGSCKKLESIVVRNCPWFTVGAVEILAFHYPGRFKKADFSGCSNLSEACVILFIKRQPGLESLSLANLSCIRDGTLVSISQSCRRLVHLDISRCSRVTDTGVKMVGEYCNLLRTLNVEGCSNVSERSLSKLRDREVHIDQPQYPSYLLHKRNQIQLWPRTQL